MGKQEKPIKRIFEGKSDITPDVKQDGYQND